LPTFVDFLGILMVLLTIFVAVLGILGQKGDAARFCGQYHSQNELRPFFLLFSAR